MSFTRTYNVNCDLTDRDGNTGTYENGTVTVGGAGGETDARALVKGHFDEQGVTATNIHINPQD